jgi:hypothetical protein
MYGFKVPTSRRSGPSTSHGRSEATRRGARGRPRPKGEAGGPSRR